LLTQEGIKKVELRELRRSIMITTAKSYPGSAEDRDNQDFKRDMINSFAVVIAAAIVISTSIITGLFYLVNFLVHR
jgi:hypothetical protein